MKTKYIIKVKEGRAYLHSEYEMKGYKAENITPLGSHPETIKKMRDKFNTEVEFID